MVFSSNEKDYQSLWIHGHLGVKSIPKEEMHSEVRGSKWIEQIIHQWTQGQNTSGVSSFTSKSL